MRTRHTGTPLIVFLSFVFAMLCFNLAGATNVCGGISSNATWTVAGSPYVATCSVFVNSGITLTIDPGVTVKFATGAHLEINGKLTAIGTAANPITFTSNAVTPTAGSWRSIYFGPTGDPNSRISYAAILYGGATDPAALTMNENYTGISVSIDNLTVSNSSSGGIYVGSGNYANFNTVTVNNCSGAGITAGSGVGVSVSNSTISSNGTYGVNYTGYSFGGLSNNTISDNGNYAIGADSTTLITALTSLTLTGNGGGTKNAVGLRPGSTIATAAWHSGATWEILGTITVPSGANVTLTIDPGVTAKFASGAQLVIDGKLVAIGTAVNPITFTSNAVTPTAGSWRSIYFGPTGDPNSRISYAAILYGGATDPAALTMNENYTGLSVSIDNLTVSNSSSGGIYVGNGNYANFNAVTVSNCSGAGITAGNGVGVTVSNSTISSNGTYGVNYTGYSFGGLSNNTISNNGSYAIGADSTTLITALTSLTLTGNGGGTKNAVGLRPGSTIATAAWHSGAVWEILGDITVPSGANVTLTIDPGVTAKFASGAILNVYGTLLANGTAGAPILFTSTLASPAKGSWKGIYIQSANNNSQLSYATVAFAGGNGDPYNGAIVLGNCAATITYASVISSSTYGIRISGTTSARSFIRKGMFADNTSGGILNTNASAIADATLNYWNDPTGPSGVAPGSGQSVSSAVKYDPWLTAAPTNPHFFTSVSVINQRFNAAAFGDSTVNFEVSTAGNWTATYKNSINTIVRTFAGSGTTGTAVWDGKDQSGTLLPDGTYTFLLQSTSILSETAAPVKGTVIIDSTFQLQIQNLSGIPPFFSPNGDAIQDIFTLSATFTLEDANWTVNIRNSSDAILRTATGQGASVSYPWDGKDSSSVLQPDGVYTAELLVSDGTLTASATRTVTLDNTFPVSVIHSPLQSTILSNVYQNANSNVGIIGTMTDIHIQNWSLDYGTGSAPASWTTLATGTSENYAATIHTWATLGLTNGPYTLRLQTWDLAGNRSQQTVTLTIGNFSMTMDKTQFNPGSGATVTYTSAVPFTLTETIEIKDSPGTVVRTLVNGVARNQGSYADVWNGKTAANALLPDGPYYYVASVTDGTNSMNWDLTNSYTPENYDIDYFTKPAWNPFNNDALTFSFSFGDAQRVLLAFSPVYYPNSPHGAMAAGCDPPNFCITNKDYFAGGTYVLTWAGVDDTGAFRPDIKGFTLQFDRSIQQNVVVMYGTKPVITNAEITVTPPLFYPEKGPQVVSFNVSSYQNQPLSGTIKFQNLESLSVLRTITLTGQNPGNVTANWDGKADNGMWVAPGNYSVTVELTDSIGNKTNSQILTTVKY